MHSKSIKEGLRVLFVMQTVKDFHYYRSIIKELLVRGAEVRLLVDKEISANESPEPIAVFERENNSFSWGWLERRNGITRRILIWTREMRTFRRFLRVKEQSTHYQDRWLQFYLPQFLRLVFKYIPGTKSLLKTNSAGKILGWIEDTTPPVRNVTQDIKQYAPDVVLVGPGNRPYPEDIEYLKAAKALRIPTVVPVFSWDNLTTKEIFHVVPDLLLVWNEAQITEVAQHQENIGPRQLRVIGAPVFDQWFEERKPTLSREEFCKQHHLRPEDPIVLYLGTTRKFSVDEVAIVRNVAQILKTSGGPLSKVQLVLRPHPANFKEYAAIDEEKEGIHIIPKIGALPNTREHIELYYNTLFYSEAILAGVHTSALIESSIADKPVIVFTQYAGKEVQDEVQHFQQLMGSGAIYLVGSQEEFKDTLTQILNGHDSRKKERAAFVKSFVRPYGLNVSAGEKAVDEIANFLELR